MYIVASKYLSEDGAASGHRFGTVDHGELSSAQLIALLQAFATVKTAERDDAELSVRSAGVSCMIRSVQGKLVLRSTREPYARALYLSPEDVIEYLDRSETWSPFEPSVVAQPPLLAQEPRHRPMAPLFALPALFVGLGAFAYAGYLAWSTPRLDVPPPSSPFSDPAELSALEHNVVGTFSTGSAPGDRVIQVKADHTLTVYELGAQGPLEPVSAPYQIRRVGGQPCLVTKGLGIVEVSTPDTLSFYKDSYSRSR